MYPPPFVLCPLVALGLADHLDHQRDARDDGQGGEDRGTDAVHAGGIDGRRGDGRVGGQSGQSGQDGQADELETVHDFLSGWGLHALHEFDTQANSERREIGQQDQGKAELKRIRVKKRHFRCQLGQTVECEHGQPIAKACT